MHSLNNRAWNYVRHNLIELQKKKESAIIVGNFKIPPSETDSYSRKKISKGIVELNNAIKSTKYNWHP